MQFSCDGFLSTTKFVIAAKAAFHFGDTYIDQSHTSIDNAVTKERKKKKDREDFHERQQWVAAVTWSLMCWWERNNDVSENLFWPQ